MINLVPRAVKNLFHRKDSSSRDEEVLEHESESADNQEQPKQTESSTVVAKPSDTPKKIPVLTKKCLEAVGKMKQKLAILEKERDPFSKTFIDLKLGAYHIKDLAKRGGFPMGVDLAGELHDYMANIKTLDERTMLIIHYSVDALSAVFVENRKSNKDELTQEVINTLRKVM